MELGERECSGFTSFLEVKKKNEKTSFLEVKARLVWPFQVTSRFVLPHPAWPLTSLLPPQAALTLS